MAVMQETPAHCYLAIIFETLPVQLANTHTEASQPGEKEDMYRHPRLLQKLPLQDGRSNFCLRRG